MPAHQIHLLPDFEETLARLVATGRYGEESDVVMHALARLEDDEVVREARAARLRAHLEQGLADIRAGRTVPASEVFRGLREKIDRAEALRTAPSRDAAE